MSDALVLAKVLVASIVLLILARYLTRRVTSAGHKLARTGSYPH
jgi:hypothetical protein